MSSYCMSVLPSKINKALLNRSVISLIFKMPFYAVAKGNTPGIYNTWSDCENQVKGFKGAKFKKFNTREEATQFIHGSSGPSNYVSNFASISSMPQSRNPVSSMPQSRNPISLITQSRNPISSMPQSRNLTTKTPDSLKKSQTKNIASSNNKKSDFEDISDIHDELMRKMDQIEKDVGEISQKIFKKPDRKAIMIDPLLNEPNLKRPLEEATSSNNKKLRTLNVTKGSSSFEFNIDDGGYVIAYTDGACSSNGSKIAKAGLGVYFGDGHNLNASEPVSGRATNNCGEIQAATRAIRNAHSVGVKKLCIRTDSQFVINSVTKWMNSWKRKGWKLASGEPVKNEIDFKELDQAVKTMDVKWEYVTAHKGILGNEMADKLAREGAAKYKK